MGNRGAIAAGDVQWMTAGSGIIHQEMPKGDPSGRMHGFQLWANLPASLKMTDPRYQEVKALDIPEIKDDDGTHVRVVCGSFSARKARWMESRPIRFTWMCRWLRVRRRRCRWRRPSMLSLTFSAERESFVTRPGR